MEWKRATANGSNFKQSTIWKFAEIHCRKCIFIFVYIAEIGCDFSLCIFYIHVKIDKYISSSYNVIYYKLQILLSFFFFSFALRWIECVYVFRLIYRNNCSHATFTLSPRIIVYFLWFFFLYYALVINMHAHSK